MSGFVFEVSKEKALESLDKVLDGMSYARAACRVIGSKQIGCAGCPYQEINACGWLTDITLFTRYKQARQFLAEKD